MTSADTDAHGRPVLCLSALAEHFCNFGADPRASLLVAEAMVPGTDPLAGGRVTLVGQAALLEGVGVVPGGHW